jgi:hypothetical protein
MVGSELLGGCGRGVNGGSTAAALTGDGLPKFIPGGRLIAPGFFIHVGHGLNKENSTIYDFNGLLGAAFVGGLGTGTDSATGTSVRQSFSVDMRFMKGVYVDVNGNYMNGSFALF